MEKYNWRKMYKERDDTYIGRIRRMSYIVITCPQEDPNDNTIGGERIFACNYYNRNNIIRKYKFKSILQKDAQTWKGFSILRIKLAETYSIKSNQDIEFLSREALFDMVAHLIKKK